MGYWICKNSVVHTATVHLDSSPYSKCRQQKPSERSAWEHSNTLPQGTTTVGNKIVHYIPCSLPKCMNNSLTE